MKKTAEKIIDSADLSAIKPEYTNKWVALTPDYKRLLAVGETLQDALNGAKKFASKVVVKVLPNLGYAPVNLG
jgi:hypothetical protein